MGTEVLRPQDCLVERFPSFNNNNTNFGYTKTHHINNNYTNYGYKNQSMVKTDHKKRYQNQNQNHQHQQQKDSTSPKKISSTNDSRASSRHTNYRNDLEMGKVTIFMRGDSLDSLNSRIKKDRTKKTAFDHADLYAGSAISSSPSPSSLPLPSFFKKQELKSFDDSATRDLRRLLNLA